MMTGQEKRILRRVLVGAILTCGFVGVGLAQHPDVKKLEIGPEQRALLEHLSDYSNLESLTINCLDDLKALPESIGGLTKLRELDLNEGNGCEMAARLPESIGNLRALEKLDLYGALDSDAKLPGHEFPAGLTQLQNLTYLDLGRNGLTEIPAFVGSLMKLRELRLNFSDLKDLPDFLVKLPALRVVSLGNDCEITQSARTKARLRRRFPRVKFDFADEYDCKP